MRVLRVLRVAALSIALTISFSSCSRVTQPQPQDHDQQQGNEQPLVADWQVSQPPATQDAATQDAATQDAATQDAAVETPGDLLSPERNRQEQAAAKPLISTDTPVTEASIAEAPARDRQSRVGEVRIPVEERKSSTTARAKGEINFDDLKFEIEKDAPFAEELLTSQIRELEGSKVKLRGYILPSTLFSETNISQFVLVRDNQECCFGPGAALFDCVMVEMASGKTTDFVTRPVTVEGKFVIDAESYRYPPGLSPTGATHLAIFRIEGESVR